MQGNIIGQSGMFVNDSLFPIYQQLNQPIEYNGIWIKTEDNLKDVYFQTDDVREYEEVNDLPFSFNGRATSIGSDIYLFGGGDDEESAYKYNSIEGTYTKLADIPLSYGCFVTAVVSNETEIYINTASDDDVWSYLDQYNPVSNTYTSLGSFGGGRADLISMVKIQDNLYLFGFDDDEQEACKFNLISNEPTYLEDIPYAFRRGSAVVINENEIALFGLHYSAGIADVGYLYIYNVTENQYYEKRPIVGRALAHTRINNFEYLLEGTFLDYEPKILTKYNIDNGSFYQYGKTFSGNSENIEEIANANDDLYLLSSNKLYKAKIVADYKGDGIYVISQETSLSKNLDVSNILDVKKIVNGEEQDILVYVGDGESWKLLNGTDITQNTNALQYALSFKEEN